MQRATTPGSWCQGASDNPDHNATQVIGSKGFSAKPGVQRPHDKRRKGRATKGRPDTPGCCITWCTDFGTGRSQRAPRSARPYRPDSRIRPGRRRRGRRPQRGGGVAAHPGVDGHGAGRCLGDALGRRPHYLPPMCKAHRRALRDRLCREVDRPTAPVPVVRVGAGGSGSAERTGAVAVAAGGWATRARTSSSSKPCRAAG